MEDKEENDFEYILNLEKLESEDKNRLIIAGMCSSGDIDYDGERVDMDSLHSQFLKYMENPVIRFFHGKDARNPDAIGKAIPEFTDSAGKVWKTEFLENGPFIVAEISQADDVASIRTKIVEKTLKGLSIGGRAKRVSVWDSELGKDVNNVIVSRWNETSIVDLPASKSSYFSVLKAACTGPNCPITNDNTEPIEKTMDTEYIEESDPVVDEAVAKFESIILENTQMHERLDKLESEIHDMITNYDTEVLKIEDNKTDNNLIEINLGEL